MVLIAKVLRMLVPSYPASVPDTASWVRRGYNESVCVASSTVYSSSIKVPRQYHHTQFTTGPLHQYLQWYQDTPRQYKPERKTSRYGMTFRELPEDMIAYAAPGSSTLCLSTGQRIANPHPHTRAVLQYGVPGYAMPVPDIAYASHRPIGNLTRAVQNEVLVQIETPGGTTAQVSTRHCIVHASLRNVSTADSIASA
eukprot:2970641-Rhodomonas_salina.2